MTLLCDAGALVALERRDRAMWRRIDDERMAGTPPITHGGVVAQVWRTGTGRQATLARALEGIRVVPLDDDLGRRAGALLGLSRTTDAIDAAMVVLALADDRIATSDPHDILRLVGAMGRRIDIIPV